MTSTLETLVIGLREAGYVVDIHPQEKYMKATFWHEKRPGKSYSGYGTTALTALFSAILEAIKNVQL